MLDKKYYVYIMTNINNTVLYTGVTNDLYRRVEEHRTGNGSIFTSRYHLTKLVYFESWTDIRGAISREKQLKGGSRKKKNDLTESDNPNWKDLSQEYFID